jgi:predicted O-methyltransferase YrrM
MKGCKMHTEDDINLGGIRFFFDWTDYSPDQGDAHSFHLLKTGPLLEVYDRLLSQDDVTSVVEVGFFDGASLLLFAMRHPTLNILGIDLRARREFLDDAIRDGGLSNRVKVTYEVSQDDHEQVEECLRSFDRPIDLVIDDASHELAQSIATFEACFPFLRAGGMHIIEDWGWAHGPDMQPGGKYFEAYCDRPALSTIVVHLAVLMASRRGLIARIEILDEMIIVHRGHGPCPPKLRLCDEVTNRGYRLPVLELGDPERSSTHESSGT